VTRILLAFAIVFVAVAAFATPALVGPSGLVLTPTTCVLPKDGVSAVTSFSAHNTIVTGSNYGAQANLEIGVTQYHHEGDFTAGGSNRRVLNVKYQAQAETNTQTGVAIGVLGAGEGGHPCFYVDFSRPMWPIEEGKPVGRAFIGVGAGGEHNDAMLPLDGLFGGVVYADHGNMALVEYDSRNVNGSLRAHVQGALSAQVAWIGDRQAPVYALTWQE
jgi:hypothetical protein